MFSSALLVAACDAQQTFAPELIDSDSTIVNAKCGTANAGLVEYPGDHECYLYDGQNFEGSRLHLYLNEHEYKSFDLKDICGGW